MKLKFSSVQQPELVGYLALLNPQNVEIEEVVGYCEAVIQWISLGGFFLIGFVVFAYC